MPTQSITIINKLGLHARASAKLTQLAGQFPCEITLERKGRQINAKSIMGVMMLAASQDTNITITTEGFDEKEALNLFAKHFETNELIPMELIEKIKKASNFLEGMQTLRQLSFGKLDMEWHSKDPSAIKNVKDFETTSFKDTQLYPDVKENCMSTSFSHIFQGGYSSGYYSYKWAEVLDADAFSVFLKKGIFDKETATKFKTNILEKGGTLKPMELYIQFRGEKPTNEALLKRAGLVK